MSEPGTGDVSACPAGPGVGGSERVKTGQEIHAWVTSALQDCLGGQLNLIVDRLSRLDQIDDRLSQIELMLRATGAQEVGRRRQASGAKVVEPSPIVSKDGQARDDLASRESAAPDSMQQVSSTPADPDATSGDPSTPMTGALRLSITSASSEKAIGEGRRTRTRTQKVLIDEVFKSVSH